MQRECHDFALPSTYVIEDIAVPLFLTMLVLSFFEAPQRWWNDFLQYRDTTVDTGVRPCAVEC